MVTVFFGVPFWDPTYSNNAINSCPSMHYPNTVCLPSSQSQGIKVKKNWDPFVLGPALAIDNKADFVCFTMKFSSLNLEP